MTGWSIAGCMKRFVSYLYSIYNNQKIHNAGFARMELRAGRNRLDIHLKENGYAGKTGTVYLFIRKQKNIQGISIGTISFRGNQADFRYEQAEENIGQTSLQIMQMNGILIMVDERAAFLSQWDEEPVDTARFEVWNADSHEKKDQTDPDDGRDETVNETIAKEPLKPENEVEAGGSAQGVSETEAEESLQVPAGTNAEGSLSEDANAAFFSEKSAEDTHSADLLIGEDASLEEKTIGPADRNILPEQSGDIRTAELKPQMAETWSQTWRTMLRMYPVLNQFDDKHKVLCVRIEIKDVRMLPTKYWSMINNSFLLHGFFNYRYLAFGRIDERWFIGIPGIYQNQEHVMATAFGFPDFLPQKDKNEREGQPGYWYRILEMPV